MYEFRNPEYFFLFLSFPLLIFYYLRFSLRRSSAVKFSSITKVSHIRPSSTLKYRHLTFISRMLCLAFLIFAAARPQSGKKNTIIRSEGIDIMLCLDISASMRAEDFPPNRLGVAKKVISAFVKKRVNDRQGLVVYGREAFLQCPLTLDHDVLVNFLRRLDFVPQIENQTAIGTALATAVNHLKESKAKSRIIILLTDGANNAGEIDPVTAAELANTYDIKVYTVGIGVPGLATASATITDQFGTRRVPMQVEMKEEPLKKIADITDGIYFNAQKTDKLKEVYSEIDKLEKSEIRTNQYLEYNEKYGLYILLALAMLILEFVSKNFIFRMLP